MTAHEARAATLLFRILENGHVKPDAHEQAWFVEAKHLLESEPADAVSPTSADDACPDCERAQCSAFNLPEPSAFQRLACCRNTIARLRSQAAEREALLRRGAELLEQDTEELDALRAELAAVKLNLWQYTRPTGYDVNGRTYGEFGFCSHKEMLFRDCAHCDAGSGRPRLVTKEKTE